MSSATSQTTTVILGRASERSYRRLAVLGGALVCLGRGGGSALAADFELQGAVAAEARIFPQSARYPGQHGANGSLAMRPEFYWEWEEGAQSFSFAPFLRLDQGDSTRSHADIRELTWLVARETWEFRAGVRRVFWGVAESNHLVDIVNQTDLVENPDTEDKLGQPMLNLALIRDWGTIDLFVLPGFRERTFPGKSGRLRTQPRVDSSSVTYDSGAEDKHVDFAVRWSHTVGALDIGLYHFRGTSREPRFLRSRTASREPVLAPHYDQIDQTGLDALYTWDNWLFKLEALNRTGQGAGFAAAVGGFEYTVVGVLGSSVDLGLLGELHYDERDERALTPFNRDVFVGFRLGMNDVQSSSLLAGVVHDLHGNGEFVNLEASRRVGERWRLEAELRIFHATEAPDLLNFVDRDDYLGIELGRYF